MAYAASEIARILGLPQPPHPEYTISQLAYDSRRINQPVVSLFFAIPGQQHDGHQFLKQAYDKGVRNFVVEREGNGSIHADANYFVVSDSIDTLQEIAAHHRQQFDIPVIGITGSNGKTTVKEWLYQMLSPDLQIVRSPNSFNSQIGVPLSVWNMTSNHELAIFEAGISRLGEMERLQKVIRPTWGLITNIGPAHDEGFPDRQAKLRQKLLLFRNVQMLFYSADQLEIKEAISTELGHVPTFTWGRVQTADLTIRPQVEAGKTLLSVCYKDATGSISIPFTDPVGIENCCHLLAVWTWLGKSWSLFESRAQNLQRVTLRLEMKAAHGGGLLVYDCYNADLRSLEVALDFLDVQAGEMPKAAILSDFMETGMETEALNSQIAALLAKHKVERVYGIGPNIAHLSAHLPASVNFQHVPSTEAFIDQQGSLDLSGWAILLKGARAFRVERIGKMLEQRVHGTVLEINLSHLVHNLRIYRQKLKAGVKVMAMVKAFSYGSGTFEIANVLQFNQVDYLAVAFTDEGVHLRDKHILLPIMVMNPEPGQMALCGQVGLEPEVYSWDTLKAACADSGKEPLYIHLKVDTGMHRLGFAVEEAAEVGRYIMEAKGVRVATVFTHLAAADDPAHDEFTREQVKLFENFYARLADTLGYQPLRHVLNSGGISRFPAYQFDMVRLGIGMYGIDPSEALQRQLKPIGRLITTVSQVRDVKPGESIGYGRAEILTTPKTIATVAIGYADGYGRIFSRGKGAMWIKGQLAPVVGNVCMDMTMIDVTGIEGVQEGDEVEVFGPNISIQAVADQADTIPYEILAGVSQRVKRVYVED